MPRRCAGALWPFANIPTVKFFSTSDYEPAVIAVGRAPVGVIAIGAFPLGVLAIGGLPMGLISVSSGIALGVVTFSCGVGVGVFGRVVGLGLGGDVRGVGLMLSWAKEFPATRLVARHESIPVADALDAAGENWVLVPLNGRGDLQSEEVRFDLSPKAQDHLGRISGHRVYAKVRAVHPAPDEPGSFRDPADPGEPYLACTEVDSAESKTSREGQVQYWLKMALVAAVVLAGIGVASQTHVENLTMTRSANLIWQAQLLSAAGVDLPAEAECSVTALVHSDGARRQDVELELECGGVKFADRSLDDCELGQVIQEREYSYRLQCNFGGEAEWTDDDGNTHDEIPGFDLDTSAQRVVITADGPPPLHVTLEVDELSTPVTGEPLLSEP